MGSAARAPPYHPWAKAAVEGMPVNRPIAFLALGAVAAALSGAAEDSRAQARAGGDEILQLLEQEKAAYNVYKAWFPNLALARRAAISFHAQLLETDYESGFMVMQLDAADMDRLRAFGFRLEPATAFIERRNRALAQFQIARAQRMAGAPEPQSIPGYSCYETVEETFAVGDALIAARPELASWVVAGPSWLKTQGAGGYDLKVLKLSNRNVAGSGGAAKPVLFVNAAIHAREYTTAPLVLEFARWLVNGHGVDADATWILDHHEVHLLLHTNPDGRKKAETGLSWRKNVDNAFCVNSNNRGVDLNRNFGFSWNSTGGQGSSGVQCDLTYRGPAAASEPETQAVENYIRSLWPDRRGPGLGDAAPADTSGVHLDIHSYSRLVLWPWGETAAPSGNATALQTMGRRLAWFNGYTPQQSIGLYPTDGTSDAPSYGELGVASFTIELGTSFFESCNSYNSNTKPANLPALVYAAKVARTPYLTPAGPDVVAPALAGAASGSGVPAGTLVGLTATATDTRFNQSNGVEATQAIAGAEVTIDIPPWDAAAAPRPLAAADGSFNSPTEALTGQIDSSGLAAGRHTVFVRARDASGAWGPVSAVFLNVTPPVVTQITEAEPNSTLDTAQPVDAFPARVTGNIAYGGASRAQRTDVDHFRVGLAPGRTLSATMTPGPATDLTLEILDAQGQVLAANYQGVGQAETLSLANASAATVTLILRISYASGASGLVGGAYSLDLAQ